MLRQRRGKLGCLASQNTHCCYSGDTKRPIEHQLPRGVLKAPAARFICHLWLFSCTVELSMYESACINWLGLLHGTMCWVSTSDPFIHSFFKCCYCSWLWGVWDMRTFFNIHFCITACKHTCTHMHAHTHNATNTPADLMLSYAFHMTPLPHISHSVIFSHIAT